MNQTGVAAIEPISTTSKLKFINITKSPPAHKNLVMMIIDNDYNSLNNISRTGADITKQITCLLCSPHSRQVSLGYFCTEEIRRNMVL